MLRLSRTALMRRAFSTQLPPRVKIAQGILALEDVSKATSIDGIKAALSVKLDLNKLPAQLQGYEGYLKTAAVSEGVGFKPDPTAWHNFKGYEFFVAELTRPNTWPFMVGVV